MHARHILVDTKEAGGEDHRGPEGRRLVRGAGQAVEGSERPERRRPRLLRSRPDGAAVREGGVRAGARRRSPQEPVQTEFGWHVIKVEEKRMSQPPSFDEVKEQLKQLRAAAEVRAGDGGAARQISEWRSSIRRPCRRRRPAPADGEPRPPMRGSARRCGAGRRRRSGDRATRSRPYSVASNRRCHGGTRLAFCAGVLSGTSGGRRRAPCDRRGRHPLQGADGPAAGALRSRRPSVAGVFTKSRCASAPVEWDRAQLSGGGRRGRSSSIPATPMPSPA